MKPRKKPLYKVLYFQVVVAIILGVLLGHFMPEFGVKMKPFGDGFIKLIKMIIAPIIFCTVVSGIAGMESLKKVGRVGGKALIYFQVFTTLALIIGLMVVNTVQPGTGMHIDPATLDAEAVSRYAQTGKNRTFVDFLLGIIPNSVVGAFVEGSILQVLMFSLLFAFALTTAGERAQGIVKGIKSLAQVMFTIIGFIMRLAPVGAFGAMAFMVGSQGVSSLLSLGELILCFYITCFLFVFVVLGSLCRFIGVSLWKLIKYIKEELLIVLGTSSSESVLPQLMKKLERLGCNQSVVGLVVPTGYSFNLDGTAIYLTMAAIFIAQACDIPLTLGQELMVLAVLLLTSKGAAGVTGSGFVTLAATLSSVPGAEIPVAGLALILGIDRIMSEARALTNLVGNTVATVAISKWENGLDVEKMKRVLDNPNGSNGVNGEHEETINGEEIVPMTASEAATVAETKPVSEKTPSR
ncbi:MAG: dicarboxylate/amino acid:cation symporter [Burkholderiales bacterium]|nr:dicarboxylate/amino acid:cation symporter [Burkholderiales bacterium]